MIPSAFFLDYDNNLVSVEREKEKKLLEHQIKKSVCKLGSHKIGFLVVWFFFFLKEFCFVRFISFGFIISLNLFCLRCDIRDRKVRSFVES